MIKSRLNRQEYILIAAAVAIIAASVIATMYLSGAISVHSSESDGGYQNITFTDAVLSCEREMRDSFGQQLQSSMLDDHSSRFETKRNRYKIFLTAQLNTKSKVSGMLQHYYINCFVDAQTGRVAHYEQLEQKDRPTNLGGSGGGGGLFGWPK